MKKYLGKMIGLAAMLLIVFTCTCAWAEPKVPETITVAETEHGKVLVEAVEDNKALITVTPDSGYMLDSIALKTGLSTSIEMQEGERIENPETRLASISYACDIPEQNATLTVTFRRARVVLSAEEMALSSAGDPVTLTATVSYTDGEVETRTRVYSQKVVFASTKEDNVTVDPATGLVTAKAMGFSRITACPYYGNVGSEDFCYVIVDGDKSPTLGTIQVNAWFNVEGMVKEESPGHSFVLFRNTSGQPVTIDASYFYQSYIPTEAYYDAVKNYDGTGYDPVTFEYVTNGEDPTDEDKEARLEYVDTLFTT